ncbi:MAG: hypothetical protein KDK71_10145 [Chlamydiia bacterium]|nr:hypothetical protein [Chlamydiia bacterium]MCP5505564.1 hypothetical protein [Chlamydiales bacterium]
MNEWTRLHIELQEALAQEITLRQEILGNMNQQEYVLLIGDIELKEELYLECNRLVHRLKGVIRQRSVLTRQIFDHLPKNTIGSKLDEVLDPLVDIESETLILYQKTQDLIEKIHSQQLRNKTLYEMIQKEGPLHVENRSLHSKSLQTKQGKRTPLITIDYPPNDKID